MSALLPLDTLPGRLGQADGALVVIALCAEWCGTCREFRPVLEHVAAAHPEILTAWADIEDDADIVGDIDLDSFPTLAIFRHGEALHFGPSLPLEAVLARLIESIALDGRPQRVPTEVAALGRWLAG